MNARYICNLCKLEFSYEKALENHKKLKHQELTEKEKKIIKISRRDALLITLVISFIFSPIVLPHILLIYDKLTNNIPNAYISFIITDRIKSRNYFNFTNEGKEFIDFLNSKFVTNVSSAFPTNFILAYTVNNPLTKKNYCAIHSPFPSTVCTIALQKLNFPIKDEASKEINCTNCKEGSFHFMNYGNTTIEYIRAKVCLNNDLIISSVKSEYIEQQDNNCFTFYKKDIFENDVTVAEIYFTNTSYKLIEPDDVLTEFSAYYGWRGLKQDFSIDNLSIWYRMYIENCEVRYQNSYLGQQTIYCPILSAN